VVKTSLQALGINPTSKDLPRIAWFFFFFVSFYKLIFFFNFMLQYLLNWRLSSDFFLAFYDLCFIYLFIYLINWVISSLFICSFLNLFF
jgi:hypothetical protein